MFRKIDANDFTCPYCKLDVKFNTKNRRHSFCRNCYHEYRIVKSKFGFITLYKTNQGETNRIFRINRNVYRDLIYTISDAEIMKYNFLENKISFEDFFEQSYKKIYWEVRNTIIWKAYQLEIPNTDIIAFFRANGSNLNLSTLLSIINNYDKSNKNKSDGDNIHRFSSELE